MAAGEGAVAAEGVVGTGEDGDGTFPSSGYCPCFASWLLVRPATSQRALLSRTVRERHWRPFPSLDLLAVRAPHGSSRALTARLSALPES